MNSHIQHILLELIRINADIAVHARTGNTPAVLRSLADLERLASFTRHRLTRPPIIDPADTTDDDEL